MDSLLVLASAAVRQLNSEKHFLEKHKEVEKYEKLTKLEEVGYILQLPRELSQEQSIELLDWMKEVLETKTLVEAHNSKLREQLKYTDTFLEGGGRRKPRGSRTTTAERIKWKRIWKQIKEKRLWETMQYDTEIKGSISKRKTVAGYNK